ncbi:MAG: helix-turn-helix domain-containing protein [Lentisphaeria bacterium]
MKINYHSSLRSFVLPGRLPLWANHMVAGRQPSMVFHDHEYSELTLILSGRARHLVNASVATIEAGDLLLIHPGQVHAYDQAEQLELSNVIYDFPRLSLPPLDTYALPLLQRILTDTDPTHPENEAAPILRLAGEQLITVNDLFSRLREELETFQPGSLFCSLARFMELVVKIARLSDSQNPVHRKLFQLGDALSHLHKQFAASCPVDDLARKACMSRRNFFRQFRNLTGCSPTEYQIRLRLQHVADLLINSNESLNYIAAQCGFYDSNDLCQKFRRHFGKTPRQFRLQEKNTHTAK